MAKRELPKHVYRQKNGIYFQRRGWPSQKFENEFGTPEFWREYAGILSQKDRPRRVIARNFGALIDSYRRSPRYRNLKPRTGLDYDKHLDWFRGESGKYLTRYLCQAQGRRVWIRVFDSGSQTWRFPAVSPETKKVPSLLGVPCVGSDARS